MTTRPSLRLAALAAAALVAVGVAFPALACPVCFGDSDAPMVKAMQTSIVFLAIVTYLLITGGVVLFLVLRRRALRRGGEGATTASAAS